MQERIIVEIITKGFTGQLRGWWDNYLTQNNRDEILNHTKTIMVPITTVVPVNTTNTQQTSTTTMEERIETDALFTLICAIIKYFSETYSTTLSNVQLELLLNLKCLTLSHFRWYKDVFVSKIFQIGNYNNDF